MLPMPAFTAVDDSDKVIHFDIPRQRTDQALIEFAEQAEVTFIFPVDEAQKTTSKGLHGWFSRVQAIAILLEGTRLQPQFWASGALTVNVDPIVDKQGDDMKKPGFLARLANALAICTVANAASPVCAQEKAEEQKAIISSGNAVAQQTGGSALEEIIVTAERRESTVQKTPISITAITGEQLRDRGLSSITEALTQVPGISAQTNGPGQSRFQIRGLSSSKGGVGATIGLYLDDTSMTPPAGSTNGKVGIDPNLYDLARIEVLRGPQGTLYGAGSMGGTIKLVSNVPDTTHTYGSLQSIGSGTDGGGFNYTVNGMLNQPLLDNTLALRFVGTYDHRSGWLDRVVVAEPDFPLFDGPAARYGVTSLPVQQKYTNVNDATLRGGRVSLLVHPTDRLTSTPSFLYQDMRQGGQDVYDFPPGNSTVYQPFDIANTFSDVLRLYSLPLTFEFAHMQLSSSTAYWERESHNNQDGTNGTHRLFGFPSYYTTGGLGVGPVSVSESNKTQQFSEEVRLASTGEAQLQWLVGAYYERYESTTDSLSVVPGLLTNTFYGPGAFTTSLLAHYDVKRDITQKAAFGNASYAFTNGFKITTGLRYFHYDSSADNSLSGVASTSGGSVPDLSSGESTSSGVNPMATLSYSFPSSVMVYGTVARGLREGSANFPPPATAACAGALNDIGLSAVPTSYGPDSVLSYELGAKTSFWDRRITINSDVFLMKWSDIQHLTILGNGCGFTFTDNAGNADSKGIELELTARVSDQFTLTQAVSYTRATYTDTIAAADVSSGDRVPFVPYWVASTLLDYVRPLGRSDASLFGRLMYTYVSEAPDPLGTTIAPYTSSRDLLNARAGVEFGRYNVSLFVNNVADRHYNLGAQTNNVVQTSDAVQLTSNQPRTIGIDLSAKF